MKKNTIKIFLVLIIVGLGAISWMGLINAQAYFYNQEKDSASFMEVGTLDFDIRSNSDFNPPLKPDKNSDRWLYLVNQGQVEASCSMVLSDFSEDNLLCEFLSLKVELDDVPIYEGSLKNFNAYNVVIPGEEKRKLFFTANLTSDKENLQEKECSFNMHFFARQNGVDLISGFSDEEIFANTVKSGKWKEEKNLEIDFDPDISKQKLKGFEQENIAGDSSSSLDTGLILSDIEASDLSSSTKGIEYGTSSEAFAENNDMDIQGVASSTLEKITDFNY